jgi:hypothetical protein
MVREVLGAIFIVAGVFVFFSHPPGGALLVGLGALALLLERLERRPPPAA